MRTTPQKKPRICVLFTGGTIGMVPVAEGGQKVLRPAKNPQEFLRLLKAEDEARSLADIDFEVLMNKDSTNVVPGDWTLMANAVYSRLNKGYDGFVIAHGTDTMHFSASALAFAFGCNLTVPIVLTGAQTSPDVPHGDARVNLLRALKVASEDLCEVVVAFGDYVFRGARVQKKDERRFDAFESPAEFPLGYITENIVLSEFRRRRSESGLGPIDFRPDFAPGIVQFSLIPGLDPGLLLPVLEDSRCQGVVLQSFGAGNVPNDGIHSFEGFIRRAVSRNKPVVIASQFPANSTLDSHYEPGKKAVEAGAIPTGNMTNAAATVKFRWVLYQVNEMLARSEIHESQKIDTIRRLMNKPYVGEVTNPRALQEREPSR